MVILGNTIEEITRQAINYLNTHKLPNAFLMENYQVSIGMLAAVRKLGIMIPEELKLIGIDEVPDYVVQDMKLTCIRIPHVGRAIMAMLLLDGEISSSLNTKIKVFAVPELAKGGQRIRAGILNI